MQRPARAAARRSGSASRRTRRGNVSPGADQSIWRWLEKSHGMADNASEKDELREGWEDKAIGTARNSMLDIYSYRGKIASSSARCGTCGTNIIAPSFEFALECSRAKKALPATERTRLIFSCTRSRKVGGDDDSRMRQRVGRVVEMRMQRRKTPNKVASRDIFIPSFV
jgi:hypothetical protein